MPALTYFIKLLQTMFPLVSQIVPILYNWCGNFFW